jgi:hypothetical protein
MDRSRTTSLMRLPDVLPIQALFEEVAREVARTDIPWRVHYGHYQSGGWWTASLLGTSEKATDGEVRDVDVPVATDVLQRMPAMRRMLDKLDLRYMMVRLAKLDPDGALWEHRDYQDLRRVKRQRIHLPLDTNPKAELISRGRRFHMERGQLWTFQPTAAHAAHNAGDRPRIHLIIDAYEDERLAALAYPEAAPCAELPALTGDALAMRVREMRAGDVPTGDELAPWERAVLRLYFEVSGPEGQLYDALARAWRETGHEARAAFWAERRHMMLGSGLHGV